jgi:hypothetical protein
MAYVVHISPQTLQALEAMPREVLGETYGEFERLAADPKAVSRPCCFPYVPIGHVFHFKLRHQDVLHYMAVFFLYGDDLESLYITDVIATPPLCPTGAECRRNPS